MIEFENLLLLLVIGVASLIITVFLFFSRNKVDVEKKNEPDISDVKIFKTQMKLVPFIYLMIILIMFVIGVFSNFLFSSVVGFVFALIPFIAYWVFDYKNYGFMRK